MRTFHLDEAWLRIPSDWRDNSIQILAQAEGSSAVFSFVVNRDEPAQGESLLDFTERQLALLASSLANFELGARRQRAVDGVVALEAEYRWRAEQGPMFQRQLYVPCGGRVLVLTATAAEPFDAARQAELDELFSSLRFRGDPGS